MADHVLARNAGDQFAVTAILRQSRHAPAFSRAEDLTEPMSPSGLGLPSKANMKWLGKL